MSQYEREAAEYEYEQGDEDLNPLEQLIAVFEDRLDEDTIVEALRVNDLDFDAAYEFLMGLVDPSHPASVASSPRPKIHIPQGTAASSSPSSAPTAAMTMTHTTTTTAPEVCKYWISTGDCRIKGCPYAHPTEAPPCKFWARGYCARGDECGFSHPGAPGGDLLPQQQQQEEYYDDGYYDENGVYYEPQQQQEEEVGTVVGDVWYPPQQQQPPQIKNTTEFPQLTQQQEEATTAATQQQQQEGENPWLKPFRGGMKINAAQKLCLKRLVDRFYWVSQEVVETVYRSTNCKEHETVKLLEEECGAVAPPNCLQSPPKADKQQPTTNRTKATTTTAPAPPKEVGWVETGEAVRQLYEDTRHDAIIHAQMRNFHFQYATQAFLAGNKALAKEHSIKGRYHDQQMKLLNEQAAEVILQNRNNCFKHMKDTGEIVLDLHGLTAREALKVMRSNLLEVFSHQMTAFIITGTGHHNQEQQSVLGRTVASFCEAHLLKPVDCSADQSGGMWSIELPLQPSNPGPATH